MVLTPPPTTSFGTLLRRCRRAAGLTQEALAAQAGMSVHGIADLEAGRRRSPRKDTVALLADALALSGPDRAIFEAAGRQKRPAATALAAAIGHGGGERGHGRLVGRTDEVARIDQHLAGAGPPLLVFAGEPGIGKSRLLREAALRAEEQGWEVLTGGCHRRSGEEPFTPLLTALERHLSLQTPAHQRQHVRGCEWLVRLLPELVETGVLTGPSGSLPPEQERRLMFAAFVRYLANAAGAAGTLLVLDDLQWAGSDALDLLAAALRAPTATPLRIVAAYRDTETRKHDPLPRLLADLAHEQVAQRAALSPLGIRDATTLLEDLLPETPVAPGDHLGLKQQLVLRAGGVPYYLISCAQAVTSGILAGPGAAASVPASVADSIRQRIGTLTAETQALLDVAAIIGRDVPRTLLLRVLVDADRPGAAVLAALDEACAARLLSENGDSAYEFAHDLVREAVDADLSTARRASIHQQVAEALEREPGGLAVELLAEHYGRSGEAEKAVIYLERAGKRAEAHHALAEAESCYRELARRLIELGREMEATVVHLRLGAVLQVQTRYDEALRLFVGATEASRTAGDAEGQRLAAARVGELQAQRGLAQDGLARLRPVLSSSSGTEETPSRGLAALHLSLSHLHFVGGAYKEQLDAATRAAELARAVSDDEVLRLAEYRRAVALAALGQVDEGYQLLVAQVIPLAEAAGDLGTLELALIQVGALYGVYWADFTQERQYIERALTIAERSGEPTDLAFLIYRRGSNAFSVGNWVQARVDFDEAVTLMRHVGRSWVSAYPSVGLGLLHLAQGNRAAATEALDEALVLAEQTRDLQALRWIHGSLAEQELLEGQLEAARDRITALLVRMGRETPHSTPILALLAWTLLEVGDTAQAEAVLAEVLAYAATARVRAVLPDALRVQAMGFMKQARWSDATSTLTQALDLSRAIQAPYEEAKVLYLFGQLLTAQGEVGRARERLAVAGSILNRLGERLYADQVEHALDELRSGAPGTSPGRRGQ